MGGEGAGFGEEEYHLRHYQEDGGEKTGGMSIPGGIGPITGIKENPEAEILDFFHRNVPTPTPNIRRAGR